MRRVGNVSAGWGVALSLTLLLFLCTAYLLRPSFRARYLFGELEALELGHSTFEDADRLAKNIGATPRNGPCSRAACKWEVWMSNADVPRWWRGQGVTFAVDFDVKDSVVVRKSTSYAIGDERGFYPSAVELIERANWDDSLGPLPVTTNWTTTDWYHYFRLSVYMTPKASAADRRRYTSFNFNCFWKYRGCEDTRELLPTADTPPPPLDK